MNKKVIWIGIASALLIGGGIFWWIRSKNKAAEEEAKKKAEEEALKARAEAIEKESRNIVPKDTYPATPFKSKEEGNAFRAWVNKNKPEWRLNGDVLSPTGEFDNTTIRAAYEEFGSIYKAEIKKLAEDKAKASDNKALADAARKKIEQRVAFGKSLFNEGAKGKKVRYIGGKDMSYDTYYFDSGRNTFTKDGKKITVDGGSHLFSDWKISGYNSGGYMWLQSKSNPKQFISANPFEFEAV
jgi:hypothetical protein